MPGASLIGLERQSAIDLRLAKSHRAAKGSSIKFVGDRFILRESEDCHGGLGGVSGRTHADAQTNGSSASFNRERRMRDRERRRSRTQAVMGGEDGLKGRVVADGCVAGLRAPTVGVAERGCRNGRAPC